MRVVTRVARWVIGGAALFALAPTAFYVLRPGLSLDFSAPLPGHLVSGVYAVERGGDGGAFAWSSKQFILSFAGLDRGTSWTLTLGVAGGRPTPEQPELVVWVDDRAALRTRLPASASEQVVAIAPRPGFRGTTVVRVAVEPPFYPGTTDSRTLGVPLNRISLDPDRGWVTLHPLRGGSVVLGAVTGAVIGLLSLPTLAGMLVLIGSSVGIVILATHSSGPFAEQPWIGPCVVATAAAALAFVLLPRRQVGARIAVATTFAAIVLQGLALLHPDMVIGDAMFQVHRFQDVLQGRYLFTSHTPAGIEFPYAIALYVFSAPFSLFTNGSFEQVRLLQTVVLIAHAVAGALLYRVASRWSDEAVGVLALVGYHSVPISFNAIATGNLTNAFGQSVAIGVLALIGITVSRGAGARFMALASATSMAFLSHLSTFALLSCQLGLIGAAEISHRERTRRLQGRVILIALAAATLIAIGVYYGHFLDLYSESLGRVGERMSAGPSRRWIPRMRSLAFGFDLAFGWPMVFAAVGGFALSVRRWRASTEATALTMWMAGSVVFMVLGRLTPLNFRHGLALVPALAAFAAFGIVAGWRRGGAPRVAAAVLCAFMIWRGLRNLVWL
jgi:hypothetical protein